VVLPAARALDGPAAHGREHPRSPYRKTPEGKDATVAGKARASSAERAILSSKNRRHGARRNCRARRAEREIAGGRLPNGTRGKSLRGRVHRDERPRATNSSELAAAPLPTGQLRASMRRPTAAALTRPGAGMARGASSGLAAAPAMARRPCREIPTGRCQRENAANGESPGGERRSGMPERAGRAVRHTEIRNAKKRNARRCKQTKGCKKTLLERDARRTSKDEQGWSGVLEVTRTRHLRKLPHGRASRLQAKICDP